MNPACSDCIASKQRPWHGFRSACPGCCARAAARSPHFRRVREAGRLDTPYRALLRQFGLEHEQVKAAAAVDAMKDAT